MTMNDTHDHAGDEVGRYPLLLLRRHLPHWRAPIALPDVLVIEAVRPNCRVVPFDGLCAPATVPSVAPAVAPVTGV